MSPHRTTATVAGVFFVVAAVAAVIGLALYQPLLHDPAAYVSGSGNDTSIFLGAFFEVLVVVAVIGTAVSLFPVVRRQNEGFAVGYLAGRTVEGVVIAVGIISLLTAVSLRQGYSATDAAAFVVAVKSLVALHSWTFLFGPNIALGVNTTLLATLMLRSGLVPRLIPIIGLVGGPLIFVSGIAEMFGLYSQVSALGATTALPVFAWEMSLAAWLIVKGFRPSPILAAGIERTRMAA
ncbi:MAG TPA: DUF4386 domain-containing protein [Candidatus Dormibacteraeota bacterium]|nr:DUF4386 domain-containing protein [Candidatus Dormibacteraeota bacterium]